VRGLKNVSVKNGGGEIKLKGILTLNLLTWRIW
jgi:hypothetical protein